MESSGDIEFSRADVTLTIAPNSPQTTIAHHQFVEFLEGSQATFRIAPRAAVTRHARHKGFDQADRCLPWTGASPPVSSPWCLPPLSRLQRTAVFQHRHSPACRIATSSTRQRSRTFRPKGNEGQADCIRPSPIDLTNIIRAGHANVVRVAKQAPRRTGPAGRPPFVNRSMTASGSNE